MKTFCIKCSRPTKANGFSQTILILLSVVMMSCSPAKNGKIIIRGSNTIGEELAPRLIEEYQKDHPNIAFDIEFKGTSYGLGALMVDRCDIAAASRDLTTNEMQLAQDRDIGFNSYVIGSYGVTVVANKNNALTNLTQAQVRDIFTGDIQNWKQIGGPDAPIHLYIRDAISGTHLGFLELAMEKKPYALHLKTFTNYTGIVQAVAKDPHGIGYSGIDEIKNENVKTISIGGIAPTVASVNQGQYPYKRVLHLLTTKAKESSAARDFIQFVESPRGQKNVQQMGFVPHP